MIITIIIIIIIIIIMLLILLALNTTMIAYPGYETIMELPCK